MREKCRTLDFAALSQTYPSVIYIDQMQSMARYVVATTICSVKYSIPSSSIQFKGKPFPAGKVTTHASSSLYFACAMPISRLSASKTK